jgi:hypothetical protein
MRLRSLCLLQTTADHASRRERQTALPIFFLCSEKKAVELAQSQIFRVHEKLINDLIRCFFLSLSLTEWYPIALTRLETTANTTGAA